MGTCGGGRREYIDVYTSSNFYLGALDDAEVNLDIISGYSHFCSILTSIL